MDLILVIFATFWAWETFRALLERFAPVIFTLSRPVHPVLAAVLPLVVLWPHWIPALAVAGVVCLMVAGVDKVFNSTPVTAFQSQKRPEFGGLPRLP